MPKLTDVNLDVPRMLTVPYYGDDGSSKYRTKYSPTSNSKNRTIDCPVHRAFNCHSLQPTIAPSVAAAYVRSVSASTAPHGVPVMLLVEGDRSGSATLTYTNASIKLAPIDGRRRSCSCVNEL